MEFLRTPDECFEHLDGYDFEPHYRAITTADGTSLRFHFVDEGPRDAAPVLLLHGNPSWSYLHRSMIRGLAARGHRVIALDLMGMGRSDKPTDKADYSLANHIDWMGQWLGAEGLTNITMYCQDWGGITGLNLLPSSGDRFARVIASNTGLPTGEGAGPAVDQWLAFVASVDALPISALIQGGTTRKLSAGELAAYNAPFPDGSYQASPLAFPFLIPVKPDNPGVPMCRDAWSYLATWTKPFLTVFGSEDQIAYKAGAHVRMQREIPGAANQHHIVIEGANHFIQEDASEQLVDIIDQFTKQATNS
jgi:haloalkane dehalogenase